MINVKCKSCQKEITSEMKFSMIQNKCPFCGSGIFSDIDMKQLSFLQEKVSLQPFSKSLDKFLVFDVSIFMLSEMKKMRNKILEEKNKTESVDSNTEEIKESEAEIQVSEEEVWDHAGDADFIDPVERRRSVKDMAKAYRSIIEEEDDFSDLEDDDEKIARLKKLAQKQAAGRGFSGVKRIN